MRNSAYHIRNTLHCSSNHSILQSAKMSDTPYLEKQTSKSQAPSLTAVNTISLTPEMFEKMYLSPQNKVKGDLRQTFGNPTPMYVQSSPYPQPSQSGTQSQLLCLLLTARLANTSQCRPWSGHVAHPFSMRPHGLARCRRQWSRLNRRVLLHGRPPHGPRWCHGVPAREHISLRSFLWLRSVSTPSGASATSKTTGADSNDENRIVVAILRRNIDATLQCLWCLLVRYC